MNWSSYFTMLTERDRRAIRIGLAVVLPVLLYVGAVKPYLAALGDAHDRVAIERELLERELALIARREKLPVALADTRQTVTRAEERLVRAANLTSAETQVTELLEQIAGLSRVLLKEVRSSPPGRDEVAPEGMQPLRIAVRGESDLEGVVTYLQRIERGPLLMRVRELTIENAPPPRAEPARGRNARPAPRPQLGVMLFTVVIEAFTPAATSTAEELP